MIVLNLIFIALRVIGPIVCAMEADKKKPISRLMGLLWARFSGDCNDLYFQFITSYKMEKRKINYLPGYLFEFLI